MKESFARWLKAPQIVSGLALIAGALLAWGTSACGGAAANEISFINDILTGGKNEKKTVCDSSAEGFLVCMSANSAIEDSRLKQSTFTALGELRELVNSEAFANKVNKAFDDNGGVMKKLRSTNYIAVITSYSAPNDTALAKATLNGHTIRYNAATVARDSSGAPDLAHVAGVMLHEIAHNIGYTHAAENPSRRSAPYFLGDLAEAMLRNQNPALAVTGRSRWRSL